MIFIVITTIDFLNNSYNFTLSCKVQPYFTRIKTKRRIISYNYKAVALICTGTSEFLIRIYRS